MEGHSWYNKKIVSSVSAAKTIFLLLAIVCILSSIKLIILSDLIWFFSHNYLAYVMNDWSLLRILFTPYCTSICFKNFKLRKCTQLYYILRSPDCHWYSSNNKVNRHETIVFVNICVKRDIFILVLRSWLFVKGQKYLEGSRREEEIDTKHVQINNVGVYIKMN